MILVQAATGRGCGTTEQNPQSDPWRGIVAGGRMSWMLGDQDFSQDLKSWKAPRTVVFENGWCLTDLALSGSVYYDLTFTKRQLDETNHKNQRAGHRWPPPTSWRQNTDFWPILEWVEASSATTNILSKHHFHQRRQSKRSTSAHRLMNAGQLVRDGQGTGCQIDAGFRMWLNTQGPACRSRLPRSADWELAEGCACGGQPGWRCPGNFRFPGSRVLQMQLMQLQLCEVDGLLVHLQRWPVLRTWSLPWGILCKPLRNAGSEASLPKDSQEAAQRWELWEELWEQESQEYAHSCWISWEDLGQCYGAWN